MTDQIDYYKQKLKYEIDSADLFLTLQEGAGVVVLDVRQRHGFEKEHIPGAVNLYHKQMTPAITADFDKSKTYVCYCDGIGCNGSTKGALNMAKLGFQVKELIGGIAWWKSDGYATEGKEASTGKEVRCAC